MKIEVHCDDGSDPNCYDTVEVDLPFSGLSDDDVKPNWVEDELSKRDVLESVLIYPSEDWVKQNKNLLDLDQIESIEKNGYFEIQYADLPHDVCAACGSDESYDSEGNNITALT
jgi:hypothetical protein